ncbi:diaminopimelate epimerase [Streptacidiphilus sp. BW17]|uniref:diaminopimelate epimerase n=1 Tax=Streptacidiphilus sp. BW17 TaxID=3156274 RepID=UPI0035180DD6
MADTLRWWKGHGAENDFIVLPDPDNDLDLTSELVRRLCDRRRGVGADGLLRAVRSAAHPDSRDMGDAAEWFMDYWNADGSQGQMCGNGIRVFARWLAEAQRLGAGPLVVATRVGTRTLHLATGAGQITVEMGTPILPATGPVRVTAGERTWPSTAVDMGNPHAVAFVDDLAEAGDLLTPPRIDPAGTFPDGVTVEFVVLQPDGTLAVRVHERGVGETKSCGTGACAVVAAWRHRNDVTEPGDYTVRLPGGDLHVTVLADSTTRLTGPAVLTAWGTATGLVL